MKVHWAWRMLREREDEKVCEGIEEEEQEEEEEEER